MRGKRADAAAVDEVSIGSAVRARRLELDQSQTTVAVRAGVSLSTVQKIEAGRHVSPRSLKDVAEALGTTTAALAGAPLPAAAATANELARRIAALSERDRGIVEGIVAQFEARSS